MGRIHEYRSSTQLLTFFLFCNRSWIISCTSARSLAMIYRKKSSKCGRRSAVPGPTISTLSWNTSSSSRVCPRWEFSPSPNGSSVIWPVRGPSGWSIIWRKIFRRWIICARRWRKFTLRRFSASPASNGSPCRELSRTKSPLRTSSHLVWRLNYTLWRFV